MKCCTDTHGKNKGSVPELEPTEERFFEQFAALEDGLSLLQLHMRGMSENAKVFASFVRHMRQSTCPTNGKREISMEFHSGYPETTAEVIQSKASYCHSK
jgi:hypothetical protein